MKLSDYLTSNAVSRRDFAAQVGITEAALSRYITGVRVPRPAIARAIMAATNGAVTPNDMIVAENDHHQKQAAE